MISPQRPDPLPARSVNGTGGFTIIEVIITIIVLTFGVMGMAGTTALVVRQVTLADLLTERSVALQTVVERVNATSFASVGTGSDSVGVFAVSWSTVSETSASKIVTVVTVGPGLQSDPFPILAPDVSSTFSFRVISR